MQNNSKNTEMIDLQLIDRYFKKGSQVEISSYDKEFLGSWYNGTVIRVHRKSLTAVVQYESRFDEKYKKRVPLVENVDLAQLRPVQPLEERREFDVNEYVDVFYHDGWWEGLVTGFYGERKVNVFFKQFRVLRPVRVSKLRPHCEWVFGKWYPDLDEEPVEPSEDELPLIQTRRMVNKVPVKSPKFEVQEGRIKSREIEVPQPSFSKRKTQSREVEVPKPSFSTRKIQSQEVKEPKVYKRKFRSREVDVHSVKTHKSRSRMVEEPSFKKHKVQSREGLYSSSKDVHLRDNMIVPVSSALPLSDGYAPNEEQATCVFKLGQPVELRSNDEGFDGAWLPATVIQTRNANKYLIEYEHILTDDEKSKLIEKVDGKLMRPCPPEVPRFGRFCNLEDVDAFYNDCWWVGAITKVLIHDEYIVYFSNTQETMKFRHSQLRVHQKWINGQWVAPTKMLQF